MIQVLFNYLFRHLDKEQSTNAQDIQIENHKESKQCHRKSETCSREVSTQTGPFSYNLDLITAVAKPTRHVDFIRSLKFLNSIDFSNYNCSAKKTLFERLALTERKMKMFERFKKQEKIRIKLEQLDEGDIERRKPLLKKLETMNLKFKQEDDTDIILAHMEQFEKDIKEKVRIADDKLKQRLERNQNVAMDNLFLKLMKHKDKQRKDSRVKNSKNITRVKGNNLLKWNSVEGSEDDGTHFKKLHEKHRFHRDKHISNEVESLKEPDLELTATKLLKAMDKEMEKDVNDTLDVMAKHEIWFGNRKDNKHWQCLSSC